MGEQGYPRGRSARRVGSRLILVFIPSVLANLAAAGEADRPASARNMTPSEFFREKFECVRALEEKAADSRCLKCHAPIVSETPLGADRGRRPAPAVVIVHAQHMRSAMVNLTCRTCHGRIDPYETSSSGLRNQVPAILCFRCHFPHGRE